MSSGALLRIVKNTDVFYEDYMDVFMAVLRRAPGLVAQKREVETARASTPPAHDMAGTVAPFRAWRG